MNSDPTGTESEKRQYVEKQMLLITEKVFGLEARLEKLATITPDRRKDIEEVASYLDSSVGIIHGIVEAWKEEESAR